VLFGETGFVGDPGSMPGSVLRVAGSSSCCSGVVLRRFLVEPVFPHAILRMFRHRAWVRREVHHCWSWIT
jgi:hypothetical protein